MSDLTLINNSNRTADRAPGTNAQHQIISKNLRRTNKKICRLIFLILQLQKHTKHKTNHTQDKQSFYLY